MRLSKSKFIAWLRAKRPDEIVGVSRDCHSCPLANFHFEVGNYEIVISENWGDYLVDRGFRKYPLPGWAAEFARAVDNYGNDITASRAFDLLNSHK